MTATALAVQSPPRARTAAVPRLRPRRVGLGTVWALIFLNVLTYAPGLQTVLSLPLTVGKLITQASLIVMLTAALMINPRGAVRPNFYLTVLSIMAILALIVSIGSPFWLGSTYRAVRLLIFVTTLWLLTPWFGDSCMPILRAHLRCLVVILGTVVLGVILAPGKAFSYQGGRLSDAIWPVPPTQVAHYSAVLIGLTIVLWFGGLAGSRRTLVVTLAGVVILLLTHTRTALAGLLVGVTVAGLSLLLGRSRVRSAFAWAIGAAVVAGVMFAPAITSWINRGQTAETGGDLTGRTKIWTALLALPRAEITKLFGSGLSNKSFDGFPIDSNWLATYQDLGLVGCGLIIVFLSGLLVAAVMMPRSPARALVLFLLAYDLVASFTEVGLGDASPYLLDLAVAASLLAVGRRKPAAVMVR